MRHVIWAFTVCQTTHLGVSGFQRVIQVFNSCHAECFYILYSSQIFMLFTFRIPVISMQSGKQCGSLSDGIITAGRDQ